MKTLITVLAAAGISSFASIASADDHLFQAQQHGLSDDSQASSNTQAFTINPAGHSGDLAPGQGSPFVGDDQQTPATDTEAANDHANVKPR
jgi:hypothetical protein